MDIESLERILADIEAGRLRLEARDLKEPSPLSQEIIGARPYAFLDDAPLEERRTRAIRSRSYLDPAEAGDLGRLDPAAIDAVRAEAWPQPRGADELHDALMLTGFLSEREIEPWNGYLESLRKESRVACLRVAEGHLLWVAAERYAQARAALPGAEAAWLGALPPPADKDWEPEAALVEILRGRMESLGPVTAARLAGDGIPRERVDYALLALEQEGFVLRGRFTPDCADIEWCERRLLARIHRYTLARLRKEIEPVSAADYLRFLFAWQGLDQDSAGPDAAKLPPREPPAGPEGVEAVLARLEGFEAPCAAWESEILPARLARYEPAWLDLQSLTGEYIWGRARPGEQPQGVDGRKPGPVKATPIAFLGRARIDAWLACAAPASGPGPEAALSEPDGPAARRVLAHLRARGASFWRDLVWETGLTAAETREGIAELVTLGWITSDGFRGLRALLSGSEKSPGLERSGRWSLLRPAGNPPRVPDAGRAAEELARALLRRYGVLFRKLADRENLAPPWRDLVRALRLLEARGEIRGGRFVEGFYGEQYALPEAVAALRQARNRPRTGAFVTLCAADPANLQGILTPGPRVPATRANRVLFRDGEPVAVLEAGELRVLPGHMLENGMAMRLKAAS
jgi:ATP-dependent Lhr-like helicase